jgi:hypothetical protein
VIAPVLITAGVLTAMYLSRQPMAVLAAGGAAQAPCALSSDQRGVYELLLTTDPSTIPDAETRAYTYSVLRQSAQALTAKGCLYEASQVQAKIALFERYDPSLRSAS